jgi:protein-S-isoprenylcysteine O-methyltransferase Ste14
MVRFLPFKTLCIVHNVIACSGFFSPPPSTLSLLLSKHQRTRNGRPTIERLSGREVSDAEIVPEEESKSTSKAFVKQRTKVKKFLWKAENWVWRFATAAVATFAVLGIVPFVGTAVLVSTAASVLISAIGFIFSGFFGLGGELMSLLAASVGIYLLFPVLGGASILLFPSVAMLIFGSTLLFSGMVQMGSDAVAIPPAQSKRGLRTEGIFKLVRHPMYSGLILSTFGLAGLTGSTERAIGSLFLFPILREQVKAEERLLREQYGEDYEVYASTTPSSMVPFLDDMHFFEE